MIEDTISQIEARLRSAGEIPAGERAELENLIAQLRRELAAARPSLPATALADLPETSSESLVDRLSESVTEFETSHPRLTDLVNRISTILANWGI